MKVTKGVEKAFREKVGNTLPFLIGEPGVTPISFGVSQVDFLMSDVEVATQHHRFLMPQFDQVILEVRIPGLVPVAQTGKITLGIGDIHIDQKESVVFAGNHPPFPAVRAVGKILGHPEGFVFGKNRGAGVAFLFREVIVTESIAEIILGNDFRVKLHFLQAEKIGFPFLHEGIESLFSTGPQAVDVPGNQFD